MYEIHNRLIKIKKISNFSTFEKMIKTCLLPKKMFYANYKESKTYLDEIKKKKMEENKRKKLEEQKQKKNNLRMSSIASYNYNRELNSLNTNLNVVDKITEESEEIKENDLEEKENDILQSIKEKGQKEENEDKIDENNIYENIEEKKVEKEINKDENNENDGKLKIEGNLKINEEEKKNEEKKDNNDDDLDLDGNLNINQQIEMNSSKNKINEKQKEENGEIKKTSSYKNKSNLARGSFERFNSCIEGDLEEYDTTEETTKNTINTRNTIKENEERNNEEKDKEDEEENINNAEDENLEKEIVIKNELFEKYKNNLFEKFLIWSLGINIEINLSSINITNLPIANPNLLEIIFVLDKEVNDIKLTLRFFTAIQQLLINNDKNSYILLINKKIYSLFLDTTFKFYKSDKEEEKKLYEMGQDILLKIFINSFTHVEKSHIDKYPCNEIDSIFLWGEKISKSNQYFNNVFEFLNDLLILFLII